MSGQGCPVHQLLTVLHEKKGTWAQSICSDDPEAENMSQGDSPRAEEQDDLAAIFVDAGSDFRVLIGPAVLMTKSFFQDITTVYTKALILAFAQGDRVGSKMTA